MELWEDVGNVLSLDRRGAIAASLRYYLAYSASALVLLAAIYLTLPLLRDAGTRGAMMIAYELTIPGGMEVAFSLPWAVPLLAAILASWCLALSKRVEYRLWRVGHNAVQASAGVLFADVELRTRERRRLDALARATGVALRQVALLGMELLQFLVAAVLLLVLEPFALPLALCLAALLAVLFRSAIWPLEAGDEAMAEGSLEPLIGHRLRMSNALRVFGTLMPMTALLLLVGSRVMDVFSFDLAGLLFLCLLVSALGTAIGGFVQHLLRFRRRSSFQRDMLAALRIGDRPGLHALLAGEASLSTGEAGEA
ncbi:MAG TPA: hypothetical protein VJ947_05485 [Pseudohaliea sp.]|nr:hypothetical protein [Pseudohaliea sp.]